MSKITRYYDYSKFNCLLFAVLIIATALIYWAMPLQHKSSFAAGVPLFFAICCFAFYAGMFIAASSKYLDQK